MKMKNRVLAVLALALLMINMAPVQRAEAATYVPDWRTEVVGNASYIDASLDYNYCFVTLEGSSYVFYRYTFCNDYQVEIHDGEYYLAPYDYQTHNVVQSTLEHVGYSYGDEKWCDVTASGDVYKCSKIVASNWDWRGDNADLMGYVAGGLDYPEVPEPDPLVLPVTEPDYTYWLYHKTTSGEYMYWSKEPFDLEVSEGKYILNLSTGDIVYRLHLSPSHTYYRQILSGSMQYVISSGDVFRSGQELVFDDVTIDAWTEGDVTSEEVQAPQYSIPHITKFENRVRGVRSPLDGPREYFFSIDLHLSGEFDAAVTDKKILIDGNYLLPSNEYFRFCEVNDYEPSTTSFMSYVKQGVEEYYITVNWSHIGTLVNRSDVVSDYMFRLTYSNAVDALIERGEFDSLYSESVQAAFSDDIRKLCCPYRLACTLIGVVDGENYYGDTYITVLYSELDSKTEDVSGVYSDYVSLDNDQRADAIESTINSAQDDKLQDYIDKKDAELDALIEEYEMKLATLDATSSFSDRVDAVFGTYSSVVNGLVRIANSCRDLSVAVGSAFAFFPSEVTNMIYAGLAVMIIISIVKALRR